MDNLLPVFIFLGILFGVQVNILTWLFIRRTYRTLKIEEGFEEKQSIESVSDIGSIEAWH